MKRIRMIAEAGINYNGSLKIAKEMVYAARECGADDIKFQTARAELLMSRYAPKAEYQRKAGGDGSQLEMCRKFLLPYEDFGELKKTCQEAGIGFLSTPFELDSIDVLHGLGMDTWKIPSGEITNLPYLEKIGRMGQKVLLSTGMSSLEEVKRAVEILQENGTGKNNITLLHCTTEYPAPYEDVNLSAMLTLKEEFDMEVGYSDHTQGIIVPVAAAALGAAVIEKHFTLDKGMDGPDHKASLEPYELKEMVRSVRTIEMALGDGDKKPMPSEIKNMAVARKSIVAKCGIKKGEIFTEKNITIKRPGTGISPMEWYSVLGKPAKKDFCEDELIER